MAWWRFGDDIKSLIEAGNTDWDKDSSRTLTTGDYLKEQQSSQHATASINSTDLDFIDPSIYETTGYADFTVNISLTGSEYTGSITNSGDNYSNISNILTVTQSSTAVVAASKSEPNFAKASSSRYCAWSSFSVPATFFIDLI